jgi:hypothetical protein
LLQAFRQKLLASTAHCRLQSQGLLDSSETRHMETAPHEHVEPCPRCEALEERIAELERRLAAKDAALSTEGRANLSLTAMRIVGGGWGEGWALRPAPARRAWMDAKPHSYQCLPLVIANQWGWQVLCPTDVRVTWDGSPSAAGLRVDIEPKHALSVRSHFGVGIVTFSPPWLFRTPPGWDLLVKGPSNRWKENCIAIEGVVETWWLNYTFTFNWKLVEPGTVTFAKGESIGQLVPVPHQTFHESSAREAPIGKVEPEAGAELLRWLEERRRIASEPVVTHKRYRKAEDIPDHLVRVPVPPVTYEDNPHESVRPSNDAE